MASSIARAMRAWSIEITPPAAAKVKSFAAHVANRHATRRLQNSEVGVGQCNRTCMRSAALLGTAY